MYENLEDSRWTTVTKKKRTKKKGGEVEAPEESNESSLNQSSQVNDQSKESSLFNGDVVMSAPRTEETSGPIAQEMTTIHQQIRNEQEFSHHEQITSRQQPIGGCSGASDPLVMKTSSRPPIPPQEEKPKAKDLNAQAVKINNFNNKMSVSHPPSEPSTVPKLLDPVVADADDGWETVVDRRKKSREHKRSKKESGPKQESVPNLAEGVLKDGSGLFQNTEEMNSTSGSSESARKTAEKKAKKKKHKRKGNLSSAEIVEIIKEIITNIGAENNKVTQAKLCTQLEAITGCTWNKHFKPKHGPMRQFLEQNGFDIEVSRQNQLMIGLSSQVSKELAEPKPTTLTPPINNSKSRRRNRKIKPKLPQRKEPPSHTKLPEFHKTSWLKTVGVVAVGCISAAVVIFGASSIR